jgi:hypothetical protein
MNRGYLLLARSPAGAVQRAWFADGAKAEAAGVALARAGDYCDVAVYRLAPAGPPDQVWHTTRFAGEHYQPAPEPDKAGNPC